MPIDYHLAKRQAWTVNIQDVDLCDPSVRKKIANWARLRGINLQDVMTDIESSRYFRYAFAKDPVRQNLYERLALDFLRGLPLLRDVAKLAAGGEKSLFVHKGILTLGENISRTRRADSKSKSIDFKFTVKPIGDRKHDIVCYAMHKYTEGEGGAQDNQYSDLRLFLYNCPRDRQECFIAFADGDYYAGRLQSLKNEFDIVSKRRVFTLNEFELCVVNGDPI